MSIGSKIVCSDCKGKIYTVGKCGHCGKWLCGSCAFEVTAKATLKSGKVEKATSWFCEECLYKNLLSPKAQEGVKQ